MESTIICYGNTTICSGVNVINVINSTIFDGDTGIPSEPGRHQLSPGAKISGELVSITWMETVFFARVELGYTMLYYNLYTYIYIYIIYMLYYVVHCTKLHYVILMLLKHFQSTRNTSYKSRAQPMINSREPEFSIHGKNRTISYLLAAVSILQKHRQIMTN